MSTDNDLALTDLAQQLADTTADFRKRAAPQRVALVERAIDALRATGIETTALRVGQAAPEVTLLDALGRAVDLAVLWRNRPLIAIFYRGGWCPYCKFELRAWHKLLPEGNAAGATLIAISPQSLDNSLTTAQKNELAFTVLSDSSLVGAEGFGIAYTMPDDLIALYRGAGHDLPAVNANGKWVLPVPATYVIDRGGRIAFAHTDADYRERAEPSDVLRAVDALRPQRSPLNQRNYV